MNWEITIAIYLIVNLICWIYSELNGLADTVRYGVEVEMNFAQYVWYRIRGTDKNPRRYRFKQIIQLAVLLVAFLPLIAITTLAEWLQRVW